jgi:hypothetical protein
MTDATIAFAFGYLVGLVPGALLYKWWLDRKQRSRLEVLLRDLEKTSDAHDR